MARRDLTGQKFGQLLVLREEGRDKNGHIIWHCVCDCGKEKNYLASNLTTGKTKSCGCLRTKMLIERDIQRTSNNIINKRFSYLTVLEKIVNNNISGRNKYKCLCDCGNITYVLPRRSKQW